MRVKFKHAEIGSFFQAMPRLQNPYTGDAFLRRMLKRILPADMLGEVEKDFTRFGTRICQELEPLADECESRPPTLQTLDPWGKRIDSVVTCDAWKKMKTVSAEEGLIAIPYESKYGKFSRVVQFTKLFLFHPSSGLYTCPLAMTDGAAKTIKELKLTKLQNAYEHLTSRAPAEFWTSGQWMTERRGGSDVGTGTETIAVPDGNGKYRLHGYKWFSSATDADMTFTLARIVDSNGEFKQGSGGLSMFFVKTRLEDGSLNNINVMKLKNKLGTKQLPTGELLLDGTDAELASDPGRGVACISNMLTITRIHNASASVSGMRRILSLSRDYSHRRECFGNKISQYPLHVDTLAKMELDTRGGMALFLEVTRLLGATEAGEGTADDEMLLRLLTPIVKLFTGKKCISVVSEGLESFGGQGYIEDTGLPRLLRDAQVTPIWEGTTNILSLDVLRAILKSKGEVLLALNRNLGSRLTLIALAVPELTPHVEKIRLLIGEILAAASNDPSILERGAREFAFSIAEATIGTLLLEQGLSGEARSDRTAAIRWVQQLTSLSQKLSYLKSESGSNPESSELVYDGYEYQE